jgi:hypothetical protein
MGEGKQCGACLFWDHRVEAEVDEHSGYCTVHEMMKLDTSVCDKFHRRTPESEQKYYNEMYNDGMDYESGDLEPPGGI